MPLDPDGLAKRMELLAAYQLALENYSAAIQSLDRARNTPDYAHLSTAARDAHTKCDEARLAVAAHRMES
jgi:hypothetical protein